jgi:hypothetical protein
LKLLPRLSGRCRLLLLPRLSGRCRLLSRGAHVCAMKVL